MKTCEFGDNVYSVTVWHVRRPLSAQEMYGMYIATLVTVSGNLGENGDWFPVPEDHERRPPASELPTYAEKQSSISNVVITYELHAVM